MLCNFLFYGKAVVVWVGLLSDVLEYVGGNFYGGIDSALHLGGDYVVAY